MSIQSINRYEQSVSTYTFSKEEIECLLLNEARKQLSEHFALNKIMESPILRPQVYLNPRGEATVHVFTTGIASTVATISQMGR